jgi:molybdopterin converting factor small subunit
MKIRVAYHGQLRLAAGTDAEEIDLTGPCGAWELPKLLAKRREALRPALLTRDGQPSRAFLLVVGDRQVGRSEELALRDGDSVALLPPVGGG